MSSTQVFTYLTMLCLFLWTDCLSQEDSSYSKLPQASLANLSDRISDISRKLDRHSESAIRDLQMREQKIYDKLFRIDSLRSRNMLSDAHARYSHFRDKLQSPGTLKQYIPSLDTLKTLLKFLDQNKELLTAPGQLPLAMDRLGNLENELASAEQVMAFINERKTFLTQQLQGLGFMKELKKLNKQAYYFSAQVKEYREALKDHKKTERKVLELVSKSKAFQDFMKKNSMLASLFRLPTGEPDAASLQGLQTRAQVESLIQSRLASGGPDARAQFQENLQSAQAQLSSLRERLNVPGAGSLGEADMQVPDFKPNQQKTKSFFKRLELGTNIQTQKANYFFPVTSDLGLSLGYKLNDKNVVGIGASYKLGLGTGWNNIKISHQGLGLRSYLDLAIRGSWFISGGYEQNYRSGLMETALSAPPIAGVDIKDNWQSSGLIGLSKKYSLTKKVRGDMRVLWDFLSYRQVPRTQPILFRVGYNLR